MQFFLKKNDVDITYQPSFKIPILMHNGITKPPRQPNSGIACALFLELR